MVNLFYTLAAIVWSLMMIFNPKYVDPPLLVFMVPPVILFGFKLLKLVYLYRTCIKTTRIQTLAAAMAGLALSHTIAKAVTTGFFSSSKPFFRTPKCENTPALIKALAASLEETAIAVALLTVATGVYLVQGREAPDAMVWSVILAIQSLPYLAALLMSLINVLPTGHANPVCLNSGHHHHQSGDRGPYFHRR